MTQPIAGLSGVRGFVRTDSFATPEQRNGNLVDPRHSEVGETAQPFPWDNFPGEGHGPYGLENELLGLPAEAFESPAGYLAQDPTADFQPITHAANWPKGVPQSVQPDEVSARREESRLIHAQGMGASREALYLPTLNPVQDDWVEIWDIGPGEMIPPQPELPAQLKGTGMMGWGSTDRNASFARQNGYGYDSAHMHRRYAAGSIPGNYMWMEPGSRPLVKSTPGAAQVPVGVDSPFAGQSGDRGYDAYGAALMTPPSEYVPPPTPALAPAPVGGDDAVVEYW